jgi:hypothetical protein
MLSFVPARLLKITIYLPLLVLNALAILNETRFLVPGIPFASIFEFLTALHSWLVVFEYTRLSQS